MYLLFDADNTLFDFDKNNHRAFQRTCQRNGLPFSEENYALYHRINEALWRELERGERDKLSVLTERFTRFAQAVGRSVDADKCNRDQQEGLSMPPIMIDGAEEVCRALAEAGHRLYLITNAVARVQRSRFAASPLPPYFQDVFISEEAGFSKPDIRFFNYVSAALPDMTAQNALVIGDSLTSDIRFANNAGLPCCWFDRYGQTAPADLRIDYTITDLTELLAIVPPAR